MTASGRTETSSSAKSIPASSTAINSTSFLFDWLQALGERALKLLGGDLRLVKSLRVDQVAHGFCLGEIDAAIEKRAHGELARLGEARPRSNAHLDDMPKHHRRAMCRDLDDVVRRIGMRFREVSDDDFVDACRDIRFGFRPAIAASALLGSTNSPKIARAWLHLMSQPQHRLGDLASLRSGKPHHPNSAPTRRSRNGDDRVVDIHRAIVAVKLVQQPAAELRGKTIRGRKTQARARNLSVADELLKANEQFVKNFNLGDLAVQPRRRLAVLACMDSRILFERCLGCSQETRT